MPKTLRLLMPQWQGGDNPAYSFGARLLAWLAPGDGGATVEVPVEPFTGMPPAVENGVVAQTALLRQLEAATRIIEQNKPDRIITFGGDCLVSQAPFAYLNERYEGRLGVLWLDAHPDVSTPEMFNHEHAMVLGNLLGGGDASFAAQVKHPLDPQLVMYGGLQKTLPAEAGIIDGLGLRRAGPAELAQDSSPVLQWIREHDIRHLAVHLDLDVMDPRLFRSLLFANPEAGEIDAAQGAMGFAELARLAGDVAAETEIVGLSIAEYLPWDALNLRGLLEAFPIFAPEG